MLTNLLDRLKPSDQPLLNLIFKHVDDSMLFDIAKTDYGDDVEIHLEALHQVKAKYTRATAMASRRSSLSCLFESAINIGNEATIAALKFLSWRMRSQMQRAAIHEDFGECPCYAIAILFVLAMRLRYYCFTFRSLVVILPQAASVILK
jgi:hypothetical protein